MANPLARVVLRFAKRLRFPYLFAFILALFIADLLIPDTIPFVDELLLGLLSVLFGAWRKRDKRPTAKDGASKADPPAGGV